MKFIQRQQAIAETSTLETFSGWTEVVQFDVNSDGFEDLFLVKGDWPNGEVLSTPKVYLYNPITQFYDIFEEANLPSQYLKFPSNRTVAADFNGDGVDDIFISTLGDEHRAGAGGYDYLHFNIGGTFSDGVVAVLSDQENWGHGTSVGDIDNDGDLDVLVSGGFVNSVTNAPGYQYPTYFLFNDGNGEFIRSDNLPGAYGTESQPHIWTSVIEDVNGDGLSDIFIGHTSGRPANNPLATPSDMNAKIFFGTASGDFVDSGQTFETNHLPDVNTDTVDAKFFDAECRSTKKLNDMNRL